VQFIHVYICTLYYLFLFRARACVCECVCGFCHLFWRINLFITHLQHSPTQLAPFIKPIRQITENIMDIHQLRLIGRSNPNNRLIDLRPCQNDDGYMDGRYSRLSSTPMNGHISRFTALSLQWRSPIQVLTRLDLTSVTESPPSKHWSPPRTSNNNIRTLNCTLRLYVIKHGAR